MSYCQHDIHCPGHGRDHEMAVGTVRPDLSDVPVAVTLDPEVVASAIRRLRVTER